eukprot:evm.model.scf_2008.3 EVM.evm.TU.scf_2008.3   scf_2008:13741-17931(-)
MRGAALAVFLVALRVAAAAPSIGSATGLGSTEGDAAILPIVLWHGMGDSCCDPRSIGGIKDNLTAALGVFVHSIATGIGEQEDIKSSYFGNVNEQVLQVCEELRGIPELQGGFNAVGFSQGGQFLRAVVEYCQHNGPKMHVLVTMGGQHQGVANVPGCEKESAWCWLMQTILGHGAYTKWASKHSVQAQYVKDPHDLEGYMKYNEFLPAINNEHAFKTPQYRTNLVSLKKLVLLRFANDTVVIPRDSSWFSFYNGTDIIPMRDLDVYKEDWIGLKQLDERGAIDFGDVPGDHMDFTMEWFMENVVEKYLLPSAEEPQISIV